MFILQCTNELHCKQLIVRVCLEQNCPSSRRLCKDCWLEFHRDHFTNCFKLTFLHKILLNQKQKISTFHSKIKNKKYMVNSLIQKVLEKVDEYQMQFSSHLENLQNYNFSDLNSLIKLLIKCNQGVIGEELLNIILDNNTSQDQDFIRQQLNEQFCFNDMIFVQEMLEEKGDYLVEAREYDQAKIIFDVLIAKVQDNCSPLLKNWILLHFLNRKTEADSYYRRLFPNFEDPYVQAQTVFQLKQCILGNKEHQKSITNNLFPLISFGLELACIQTQKANFIRFWQLFLQASFYCYNQKFDDSLKVFEQILEQDPQNCSAIYYIVTILLEIQQYEEAHQFCDNGLAKFPQNRYYVEGKWRCLIKYPKDTQAFFSIENHDPNLPLMKGLLLLQIEQQNNAIHYFDQVQPQEQGYYMAQFFKGSILYQLKQRKEAFKIWAKIKFEIITIHDLFFPVQNEIKFYLFAFLHYGLKVDLDFVDKYSQTFGQANFFYIFKSFVLKENKKYNEALIQIQLGRKQFPKCLALLYFETIILIKNNNFELALVNIERLIESKYLLKQSFKLQGKILYLLKKPNDSLKAFQQLCAIHPDDPESIFCLGYIILCLALNSNQSDQFNEASYFFEKVLSLDKNHISSLYIKAILLLNVKRQPAEALKIFQQIADYKKTKIYIIYALMNLGQLDQALKQLTQWSNQKYTNIRQVLKCDVLFQKKQFSEALLNFKIANQSKFSLLHFWQFALTLIYLERHDEALTIIEQADNAHFLTQSLKGLILQQLNQVDKALEQYHNALNQKFLIGVSEMKTYLLHQMQIIGKADELQVNELFLQQFKDYLFGQIKLNYCTKFKFDNTPLTHLSFIEDIPRLVFLDKITFDPYNTI